MDSDTNNVSLFEVLEQITIEADAELDKILAGAAKKQVPALPINADLMVVFGRTSADQAEKAKARVLGLGPNKQKFGQREFELDMSEIFGVRTKIQFPVLPIFGAGMYEFVTELATTEGSWQQVHSLPLRVHIERSGKEPPTAQSNE